MTAWARRASVVAVLVSAGLAGTMPVASQSSSVRDTVHNLSASGPGEIRALSETEVCKFCHIPHNAVVPEPLWGHALSSAQYAVPDLRDAGGLRRSAPQPDGSSRLCLSCHDGTVALGEIAGEPGTIRMLGADRLVPGRRGHLGTDISGSHPISFVVAESYTGERARGSDMALRELAMVEFDPDVRLDARGKMQCTTCHDPHSDANYVEGRVPRFWVKTSIDEVCLTCHELR